MKIRPKCIFVTSNYKIEQIWAGPILSALLHRFDLFYLEEEDKPVLYKPRPVSSASDRFLSVVLEVYGAKENVSPNVPEAVQAGPSTKKTLAEIKQEASDDDFVPSNNASSKLP